MAFITALPLSGSSQNSNAAISTEKLILIAGLADPACRQERARILARALGAEELIVFTKDSEVGVLLPAPGFPQTLPNGMAWRSFLVAIVANGAASARLPYCAGDISLPAYGVSGPDGSVLVLVGGAPRADEVSDIRLLLPLLAAAFHGERMAATAGGQVAVAQQAAAQAHSLTEALDRAHRDLAIALREAEAVRQRFAQFMQHLSGLAWIKDQQGRYLYANDSALEAFGGPAEEVYGRTDEQLFPPEIAARFRENDRRAVESRSGVQVIESLKHHDGSVHHSLVTKFVIPPSGGEPALIGGMAIDITELRRAEEALRESEERFRQLAENIEDVFWMVDAPSGHVLFVSPAYERVWGRSCQSLYQDPRSFLCSVHQDDRERVNASLQRQMDGESTTEEYRVVRPDGAVRWVLDRAFPIRDASGQVYRIAGIAEDITERKRVETALQDARSRLDAALEAGAIFTWTWDISDNRIFTDEKLARLFGLSPSEGAGGLIDNYAKAIHPEDWPSVTAALEQAVREGVNFEADYRILQSDGSLRWVSARGRAQRNETGQPVRMPGVLVDITERKRLEEELRQRAQQLTDADRRKDEFLATLAHELRNPLAPIRNSLQILKLPNVDSNTVKQTREMMERQVHHLVRLVDDLLDVSRVMRGKIELRKEPVELATVVSRAVEMSQPLIEAQRHKLEITLPAEPLRLNADPVRLAQVVGNLLTNSAKYSDADGRIRLTARKEGSDAVLEVQDDGIGIAPEVLPHIFDLFVQADHASTKAHGGLGIGLTLVKNLTQMHDGTVEAYSDGLGHGCTFVVRLPLYVAQEPSQSESIPAPSQVPPHGSRHKLLIVDDNKDSARSLAMLMRLQGHEVRLAHSGAAALEIAAYYHPAMVLLDIGMPEMDGLEVARRMRQLRGFEKTVLVALTGWGQQEDRRRTSEAGFDHHLVKPPEFKALERLLASLPPADAGNR